MKREVIFIRVIAKVKKQLEKLAKAQGITLNEFIVRILETIER